MKFSIGVVDDLCITKHASRRLRQRLGITKGAVERNAIRALTRGIAYVETGGYLKSYLTFLYMEHNNANNIRIYCNYVYLFHDMILVTVLPLPQKFRKTAEKLEKRKRSVEA